MPLYLLKILISAAVFTLITELAKRHAAIAALFIAMPWLLRHGWSFYPSPLASSALTVGLYGIEVRVLGAFGIKL